MAMDAMQLLVFMHCGWETKTKKYIYGLCSVVLLSQAEMATEGEPLSEKFCLQCYTL